MFESGCSGEGGGAFAQVARSPPQCKVPSVRLRSRSPVLKKPQSASTGTGSGMGSGPRGPRTSPSEDPARQYRPNSNVVMLLVRASVTCFTEMWGVTQFLGARCGLGHESLQLGDGISFTYVII